MKITLQIVKGQIEEIKIKHEALENVVNDLVKKVSAIKQQFDDDKKVSDKTEVSEQVIEVLTKEYGKAIKHIEDKLDKLESVEEQHSVKVCKYQNRGRCKNLTDCKFYHPESVCGSFLINRLCVKQICRDRHPKACRYWKRGDCWRGQICYYNHQQNQKQESNKNCDRCNEYSPNTYYCEVCGKDFCPRCTIKEAHENIIEAIGCDKVHQYIEKGNEKQIHVYEVKTNTLTNDDQMEAGNSMETIYFDDSDKLKKTGFPYTDEVDCLCGQTNGELFKCLVCMKTFCEICPLRLIFMDGTANCIECILN